MESTLLASASMRWGPSRAFSLTLLKDRCPIPKVLRTSTLRNSPYSTWETTLLDRKILDFRPTSKCPNFRVKPTWQPLNSIWDTNLSDHPRVTRLLQVSKLNLHDMQTLSRSSLPRWRRGRARKKSLNQALLNLRFQKEAVLEVLQELEEAQRESCRRADPSNNLRPLCSQPAHRSPQDSTNSTKTLLPPTQARRPLLRGSCQARSEVILCTLKICNRNFISCTRCRGSSLR